MTSHFYKTKKVEKRTFRIDIWEIVYYTECDLNWNSVSEAGLNDRRCEPAKAIRTAGSNAENRPRRLATSVALLIELKAQFYKLVPL